MKSNFGFDKNERSGFKYWFSHWCAYNMTALVMHAWKPKYLLHDIEKPWLKLILRDYKKVQKWHRTHSKHHLDYGDKHGYDKVDWEAAVIDWECSRFTKRAQQRNARQFTEYILSNEDGKYSEKQRFAVKNNVLPILDKIGL